MTRYFFHFHECGSVTTDEEGGEFEDDAAALSHAMICARDVMAGEVLSGSLCLNCHIEIVHGGTGVRNELAFMDALNVSGFLRQYKASWTFLPQVHKLETVNAARSHGPLSAADPLIGDLLFFWFRSVGFRCAICQLGL